jgi:hypothetical protein
MSFMDFRNYRQRDKDKFGTPKRKVKKPYTPKGVGQGNNPQQNLRVRPRNPLPIQEKKRHKKFKEQLLARYDTNEYVRREELTSSKHGSEYGKIDSEGYRKYTTITNIPYRRNKPSHHKREKKIRQYAYQNEFVQSKGVKHSADQDVFRFKRTVYSMKKKQPVKSNVGNERVNH